MKVDHKNQARTNILKRFVHLELASAEDSDAEQVDLGDGAKYYLKPKVWETEGRRRDGKPIPMETSFNCFPLVVNSSGKPWAEANLFILFRVQQKRPSKGKVAMRQFTNIAEDLAAFLRFLEEYEINWLDFPKMKFRRPTYRFQSHINAMFDDGQISHSLGRRRAMTVVHFYNWLNIHCMFKPDNPMWEREDVYLPIQSATGFSQTIKRAKVDVAQINGRDSFDSHSEYIEDGGKLRPLPDNEQRWLLEALTAYGNTEVTLFHYFGLFVGARIQTVLTCTKGHVWHEPTVFDQWGDVRMRVGPASGIDTKRDKKLILHIPAWLYQLFHTYSHSERSRKRRIRATGGDIDEQYLFLTTRGNPFYESKQAHEALQEVDSNSRYSKVGGAMRMLIRNNIIPYIRKKYDPKFDYQIQDLRATFGMNKVDARLETFGYAETLRFVQGRLGHASPLQTERYLRYRERLAVAKKVQDSWESELEQLARYAMEKKIG